MPSTHDPSRLRLGSPAIRSTRFASTSSPRTSPRSHTLARHPRLARSPHMRAPEPGGGTTRSTARPAFGHRLRWGDAVVNAVRPAPNPPERSTGRRSARAVSGVRRWGATPRPCRRCGRRTGSRRRRGWTLRCPCPRLPRRCPAAGRGCARGVPGRDPRPVAPRVVRPESWWSSALSTRSALLGITLRVRPTAWPRCARELHPSGIGCGAYAAHRRSRRPGDGGRRRGGSGRALGASSLTSSADYLSTPVIGSSDQAQPEPATPTLLPQSPRANTSAGSAP